MSDDNVISLAPHIAKREQVKEILDEYHEDLEEIRTMVSCPVCQNRAFSIIESKSEDPTFPGHDIVCTACDAIIELPTEGKTK